MVEIRNTNPKSEVRNLLFVLCSAVLAAALFGSVLIYYYGGISGYRLTNVLLAPDTLDRMSYSESHIRYKFDRIEFTEFDGRQWRQELVSPVQYRDIYSLLSSGTSIEPSSSVLQLFQASDPYTLKIWVKPESTRIFEGSKIFQEVTFVQDHFRVELHEEGSGPKWAYFYSKSIQPKISLLIHGQ